MKFSDKTLKPALLAAAPGDQLELVSLIPSLSAEPVVVMVLEKLELAGETGPLIQITARFSWFGALLIQKRFTYPVKPVKAAKEAV